MSADQTDNLTQFAVTSGIIDSPTANQMEQSQKPVVLIPGGNVSISNSAYELFGHIAKTKEIFLFGGAVCQLITQNGRSKLEELTGAAASSRFEDFVQFSKKAKYKDGKETIEPTVISKTLADQYLQANAKSQLPEIRGIINCPIITEQAGQIHIFNKGYDPVTKLLITQDVPIGVVSLEDAVMAISRILQEFNFQTPNDLSRAIASFLTPALKFGSLIRGAIPADVAEADASQSGKTYRQNMIAALYNEKCSVVTKPEGTGVGSYDERFSTALIAGNPFIQFDNVRGKIKLQALESFMTSNGMFSARAAYSKSIEVDPSRYVIMISSNGFETTPDLANRSSLIRIFKRHGYDFKNWSCNGANWDGILGFIQAHQPLLLSCIFCIITEWHSQGKQRTNETRHAFREWCQVCDWIVQNIFNLPPLMDGHEEAQKRTSNPDFTFLRNVVMTINTENRLGAELKASDVFELCEENSIFVPGLSHDKRSDEEAAAKTIGRVLGRVFENSDTALVDAFTVTRKKTRTGVGPGSYESKVYIISKNQPVEISAQT